MLIYKRLIALIITILLSLNICICFADEQAALELSAKSTVLMEASTGKILFEKNSHEKLLPASVTKVMTLLLIMEAIDSGRIKLEDNVLVSEYASSMGGSQVYLATGEEMSVHELLKAVAVASGNDASVALAEHTYGSEQSFVNAMNDKAKELGMNDTIFYNTTGLDDEEPYNVTSANDIALMSRELIIKYPKIIEYTTIWTDSIRNGEFGLANTNKLIRFYPGANGLKTGSTTKAKFNLSATATRDNLQLIATVMCSPNSQDRFEDAKKLLNYGFANYRCASFAKKGDLIRDVNVEKGVYKTVNAVVREDVNILIKKGQEAEITSQIDLLDKYSAPLLAGQKLGELIYKSKGVELYKFDIVSQIEVPKINIYNAFKRIMTAWISNLL